MSEPTRAELLSKIHEVIHRAGHLVDDSEEVGPDETEPQEVLAMHLRDLQRAVLALIGDDELHDAIDAVMNALGSEWKPIDSAPTNGTPVEVYAVAPSDAADLPPMIALASYHPDAGWCVCELREPTHWRPHNPPSSGASDG